MTAKQPVSVNELSTILLDMDGTLLDLHFDYHFWNEYLPQRFAEIHETPHEQAELEVRGKLKAAEGTLNWYCTDYWSDTFNLDIMALKMEVEHLVQFREGTTLFLDHVHAADLQVVLVTNAHPNVLAMKEARTGLLAKMDAAVTSHELGHAKEHKPFWDALKQRVDYDPETTLMVDDSLAVLRAARAFGTRHQLRVNRPNSRVSPITCDEFVTIDDLSELIRSDDTP